jgi:hypothetical protein
MDQTNKPNELVLRALAKAFTGVGQRRGIEEWVEIGRDLNQSADELAAPPEKPSSDPKPGDAHE